jgi:hypothetical protein
MRSNVFRSIALVGASLALTIGATSAAGAMNPTDPPSHPIAAAAAIGTHYAIGVPLCPTPAPGQAQCMAIVKRLVTRSTPGARPYTIRANDVTAGPAGGLTPKDFASAYGFKPSGGAGQTVAVVDAYNDPNIIADLDHFDEQYGLPAETASSFRVVNQAGQASPLPTNDTTGWSGEESLDVDTVRGVCHACKLILVEATDQAENDLAAATASAHALHATEISNSYGFAETEAGLLPNEQAAYNFPGTVVTVSTGDDGWYDFDYLAQFGPVNSPSAPSSLPDVVAVGGTTLNLNPGGTRRSESVWNDDGTADNAEQASEERLGATGGGCSTLYTAASWQQHVAGWKQMGCGTKRLAADVSADADYLTGLDVYDSYSCGGCSSPGWITIGGTSLASPLVAAMWALAGGAHGMKSPAATLYGHLGDSKDLYDVVSGGDAVCDGSAVCEAGTSWNTEGFGWIDCGSNASGQATTADGQCDAGPGYDGPSGVGAPNGLAAFVPAKPRAAITRPAKIKAHKSAAFSGAKSKDPYPGGSITSYSWSWGDGSAHSSGKKTHHSFKKAGTFTVTLTVKDKFGQSGSVKTKVKVKK